MFFLLMMCYFVIVIIYGVRIVNIITSQVSLAMHIPIYIAQIYHFQ